MVIPEPIRKQAKNEKGDEVEIGYANGLIVNRKRKPLNATVVRKLLIAGSRLPEMTAEAEAAVARALQHVRIRRKK